MELILRFLSGMTSRLRIAWYRARGVRFKGAAWLRHIEIPRNPRGVLIGDGAALDRGVVLLVTVETGECAAIEIGARCYVNRHTIIDASESIRIDSDCMIGPFCYVTDHNHLAHPGKPPSAGRLVSAPTVIGARCWLGAHVTILKGVTIGDNTVVGAGSVVTESLPPRVIAVGSPARVLRAL